MTDREWLANWAEAVNADAENAHIGRWSAFVVRLQDDAGGEETVRYEHGTVVLGPAEDGSPAEDAEDDVITLRGRRSAWRELVDPHAAPRRHDLLALTKAADGIEIVAGRNHLIRHLRVLTRLVELGRARG
ncbi:hypothetical protein SAMN05661080_04035 [Modestobacter sp. DSM 44400]|uniref:hypothetical protein n=1 Tax=Modestobacter sp. DSM 44400 TaxID=1550230 RepID=UPI000896D050|nr:hypothetical protein [Modestobacter sp. DSM 44400]SDY61344.1 hypothetical protein SAMN05661080_04035 [Modestobacter sp. DSM 44400]